MGSMAASGFVSRFAFALLSVAPIVVKAFEPKDHAEEYKRGDPHATLCFLHERLFHFRRHRPPSQTVRIPEWILRVRAFASLPRDSAREPDHGHHRQQDDPEEVQ